MLSSNCDKRHIPLSNDDSTHAYFHRELYDKVPTMILHVYAINPDINEDSAAEDYVAKIWNYTLLLGMGPDGHTCSLFPDHPGLQEDKRSLSPSRTVPSPLLRGLITLTMNGYLALLEGWPY
jgi:6-phosphogluconolactonase